MIYTYKLKHFYSRVNKHYAVRSEMDYRAFNFACAYIQLIREELPSLPFIDDVIGEEETHYFMQKYYQASSVDENVSVDYIIDLHENWEVVASRCTLNMVNAFAASNARYTMLKYLCETAKQNILKCEKLDQIKYANDFKRLERMLAGEAVKEAWQWENLSGKKLTGLQITESETPDYLAARIKPLSEC